MNHRQHPGVIRSAVVAYAGFLRYAVIKLQNQIPKPYKIAFIVKTATGAEADGVVVDVNSLVSMNMWGFIKKTEPEYYPPLENLLDL